MNQHELALLRRAAKIERLRRNFRAFCESQLYIRPKSGPPCRYKLNPAQELIESVIEKQWKEKGWVRVVEFKCRQFGGSTHGVARACHRTFLNENVSSLIIANDDSATSNLFDMAGLYYDSLDGDIRPVRRFLNKQEIVLENPDVKTRPDFPGLRSRIQIQSAKNVHSGVGTTRNWVHLSEQCRFGSGVKDLMGSLIPAIPLQPGTGIINESAPFGYGEGRDAFRQWCEQARSGKDQYAFIGIYWWMQPEYRAPLDKSDTINGRFRLSLEERRLITRVKAVSLKELGYEVELSPEQIKYRRLRIEELGRGDNRIGEALFQQQFPHDYDSGWETFEAKVFAPFLLQQMKVKFEQPPMRRCDYAPDQKVFFDTQGHAPLWIWEEPLPGEMYDIGVDSAQGNGGDYSTAQVFKRSNNEQVAEYKSNEIAPFDYGHVVVSLGEYYNYAHVGIEVEGIGYAVNEQAKNEGYPNLYIWRHRDRTMATMSSYSGWKTQFDTKRLLVATAQDLVLHQEVIVHSSRLYREMQLFCQDWTEAGNEKFYTSEGHDDLIMAAMITWQIAKDEKVLEMPMEKGATLERPTTLAERNKRLQEGLEKQQAFMDDPEAEGRMDDDPWRRLEQALKGEYDH